ncbi:MAG TPA: hypothetical protein VEH47_08490 [Candidatus Acidoferrales bacterium]|nr:hypothetical protein [Candidatus Acidoferrales bacterium]
MPSKQFEEKQIVEKDLPKESLKEKEALKAEKNEKSEKQENKDKQEKVEKELKEQKEHKDVHDIKQYPKEKAEKESKEKEHKEKEKEHKLEGKESLLEKFPKTEGHEVYPQAQLAAAPAGVGGQKSLEKYSAVEKFQKEIKAEIKEFKHEKIEIKEKFEIKEFKHEKFEKFEYEGVVGFGPPGGPVEQRVAALEAAVAQLLHFIPENLRPDLSQGALKQEPDAAKQGAVGTAKAPEAKEPQGKGKS